MMASRIDLLLTVGIIVNLVIGIGKQQLARLALLCNVNIVSFKEGNNGEKILKAAMAVRNTPYQLDSGGWRGPSVDYKLPKDASAGFDCSGLVQYSVFMGTGKIIARLTTYQAQDPQCRQVPFEERQTGDLIFFSTNQEINHVGIIKNKNRIFHSPMVGAEADEGDLTGEHTNYVTRCWES